MPALVRAGHRLSLGLPAVQRDRLSFRAVNRREAPGYEPELQRHHILPRQILTHGSFTPMLNALGVDQIGFDDFRRNGLLLPANDAAAVRIGLPLHRGPHRDYNAMVMERIGQIELGWSSARRASAGVWFPSDECGLMWLQSYWTCPGFVPVRFSC